LSYVESQPVGRKKGSAVVYEIDFAIVVAVERIVPAFAHIEVERVGYA